MINYQTRTAVISKTRKSHEKSLKEWSNGEYIEMVEDFIHIYSIALSRGVSKYRVHLEKEHQIVGFDYPEGRLSGSKPWTSRLSFNIMVNELMEKPQSWLIVKVFWLQTSASLWRCMLLKPAVVGVKLAGMIEIVSSVWNSKLCW